MSDLDRLFYWRGIAADYLNYREEHVSVPLENRVNLLSAMGVDTSSGDAISKEVFDLDVAPWLEWLPNFSVTRSGNDSGFLVNVPSGQLHDSFHWKLSDDDGQIVRSGGFCPAELEEIGNYEFEGRYFTRRKVVVPGLPPRYFDLFLKSGNKSQTVKLASLPTHVYQAPWSDENQKVWGFIIQLYTLRSDRSWGIGDFSDLKDLIYLSAERGAEVIGLNPLHALSVYLESHFSPYSPSDRRFISPLYIDPELVDDYVNQVAEKVDQDQLRNARESDKVDYVAIRNLKYSVYQSMFEQFIAKEIDNQSDRYQEFKGYVESSGSSLRNFAYFEACHQQWTDAKYVLRYMERQGELEEDLFDLSGALRGARLSMLFHCYLQWVAASQLSMCHEATVDAGMKVGLVRDLAVGADGGGAEVSTNQDLFCREASIGAPPDPFAQTGQNWGLPPVSPAELRASGFRHFIELLRDNMKDCGALRIDHAMSLMRLWWCPPHQSADHGAYVYYPFDEMLGLLALESQLNKCLIIGEDLGVVPADFRKAITDAKIFTNKVFYFEKVGHGTFKAPENYDSHALAMVNNHDVPTLVSWWNGSDLQLRDELNLLEEGVDCRQLRKERRQDKANLMDQLYHSGLYPESWHGRELEEAADEALIDAILVFVAKTSSKIFMVQLEDLLMMDSPVNVPGTFHEHANWQRKLSKNTSEIFSGQRVSALLRRIDQQRKY